MILQEVDVRSIAPAVHNRPDIGFLFTHLLLLFQFLASVDALTYSTESLVFIQLVIKCNHVMFMRYLPERTIVAQNGKLCASDSV